MLENSIKDKDPLFLMSCLIAEVELAKDKVKEFNFDPEKNNNYEAVYQSLINLVGDLEVDSTSDTAKQIHNAFHSVFPVLWLYEIIDIFATEIRNQLQAIDKEDSRFVQLATNLMRIDSALNKAQKAII